MSEQGHIWHGPRPSDDELAAATPRALGITRAEGYRLVSAPPDQRRPIRIDLSRVLEHLVFRGPRAGQELASRPDILRYKMVPRIIPTLKKPAEIYETATDAGLRRLYVSPPVMGKQKPPKQKGQEPKKPKATFNVVSLIPLAEVQRAEHAATIADPAKRPEWKFWTAFPRYEGYQIRRTREEALKAGRKIWPRLQTNPAYMGPREPGRVDRAAQRLPGAAPALTGESSASRLHLSSGDATGLAVIVCGLIGLRWLAVQRAGRPAFRWT